MTDNVHRLVGVDEFELICSQERGGHLEDIRVSQILAYARSFPDHERDNELLEVLRSSVVEARRVVCGMVLAPYSWIVVQGMDIREHLSLNTSMLALSKS